MEQKKNYTTLSITQGSIFLSFLKVLKLKGFLFPLMSKKHDFINTDWYCPNFKTRVTKGITIYVPRTIYVSVFKY